jgi:hypothetical protein
MPEDPYAAWARAARADSSLPRASFKVLDMLESAFRAGDGRAVLSQRQIIDGADLLDEGPLRTLIYHGWLIRHANGDGPKRHPQTYLPTLPLKFVALLEAAA